ncbi:MAG TPA: RNA 2',3'-cyclic phosphodiesterase [Solirubrobacteraceae bacterium]|nr:RNA 2',3'-cyclic phosphodiesterase [Solirubrobacteraceae bacterium]
MSGELRLFIAAEPPRSVRAELAGWARSALGRGSQARCLDVSSLHLTLCFLGSQPSSALGELKRTLAAVHELAAAVGPLCTGAPAWLPPRQPRVLAVEIADPDGALAGLHSALCSELERAIGWSPPRQRFRPHVTVARMRPGAERARALEPTPAREFSPTAVTLFHSMLDPGGAHYAPLASIEL